MNRKVLILSGPTHEYIDPVRFIGNASSGLMGKALAEQALAQDFMVEFVSGPVAETHLPVPGGNIRIHHVVGANEMLARATELFPTSDAVIFAAAVADYAPAEKRFEKMAKSEDDLILRLCATPDIAKTLCSNKSGNQIAIGFALQTSDGEKHARRKLERKNLDGIVLNTPATLGARNGTFSFLASASASFDAWGTIDKSECAKRIIEWLCRTIRGK
ncbi:Coenzyme A biosynthesis bifunctional protein CoaBC [Pontiella desulfatans]|uniref:Coenzyme A biosynthesis bifunctional protein CoaBC n=1 Tax=Pontiella desulfatans TaxID=2750659 RepID=A0A6C2U005_PONDE|nr:phosphopantothenoylcysteine decarboxylase [Pontiella desulfatans]VGO12746.1 Coenzyme A biosynthesis bifunctional protein CoaBC [Pontiella desulfatans]